MILEVTLTCISVQDQYLERLEFSSVSFIHLFVRLLLLTYYASFMLHCMILLLIIHIDIIVMDCDQQLGYRDYHLC